MPKRLLLMSLVFGTQLLGCSSVETRTGTSPQLTSQATVGLELPPASERTPPLIVEQVILARDGSDGKLEPVESNVFKRGQSVNLVLLNVEGFHKGSDGKNRFDMDMQVKDPEGQIILSQQSLLAKEGHRDLPGNIARSPYGIFNTSEKLKPGNYTMTLTLYDLIGKGVVSKSKTVILK